MELNASMGRTNLPIDTLGSPEVVTRMLEEGLKAAKSAEGFDALLEAAASREDHKDALEDFLNARVASVWRLDPSIERAGRLMSVTRTGRPDFWIGVLGEGLEGGRIGAEGFVGFMEPHG